MSCVLSRWVHPESCGTSAQVYVLGDISSSLQIDRFPLHLLQPCLCQISAQSDSLSLAFLSYPQKTTSVDLSGLQSQCQPFPWRRGYPRSWRIIPHLNLHHLPGRGSIPLPAPRLEPQGKAILWPPSLNLLQDRIYISSLEGY